MTTTDAAPLPSVTLTDILAARTQIGSIIQVTPLDYSKTFSDLSGSNIYLKLENLQKTGSFKLRGALNKISNLSRDELARGVVAASAGNHAQGVAYAAQLHGAPCTIVMPETASLAKIAATQGYGATVVLAGGSYDEAYEHACKLRDEYGYTYVHAFDDPRIVAGQGTIGLEILDQLPAVDTLIVPMGGGGLISGIAVAAKALKPGIRVIGVQSAAVPSFRNALDTGRIETVPSAPTIADGIAVRRPGELTYRLVKTHVDDVLTVSEEEIARSMVLLMERSKIVAEGSAAAALAACIYHKVPRDLGNAVVVLSGGNVDVTFLSRIIEHGLVESGRYLRLSVKIEDRPGSLRDLLGVFAELGANVISVQHYRVGSSILLGQTEVEVDLETKDRRHIEQIMGLLHARGYQPADRC
ncbi:MAG: threonine ammonia-lyase [Alicyclobacillus sp.]|nr:threonine ammonia-lyase [Alicyclobacillus sp.]